MSTFDVWFYSLPPFTKCYLCGAVACTLVSSLELISPYYFILDFTSIFTNLQIWRILTCFLYFGSFDFMWLVGMSILVRFTRSLEVLPIFLNNPPAFYWGMLCLMIAIIPICWILNIYLLGYSLIFAIIYIWSRYEPEVLVNFFWGFKVKAVQFPFVLIGLSVLLKSSPLPNLVGLVVGELFYVLKEKVPVDYGYEVLNPPEMFCRLIEKVNQRRAPQAQNVRFGGRGYRLN